MTDDGQRSLSFCNPHPSSLIVRKTRRCNMKVGVIGGSGLIGKKLVAILRQQGHEAVSASPSSGVNALTGEGLAGALAGANVVVDVLNSSNWADEAATVRVTQFFEFLGYIADSGKEGDTVGLST